MPVALQRQIEALSISGDGEHSLLWPRPRAGILAVSGLGLIAPSMLEPHAHKDGHPRWFSSGNAPESRICIIETCPLLTMLGSIVSSAKQPTRHRPGFKLSALQPRSSADLRPIRPPVACADRVTAALASVSSQRWPQIKASDAQDLRVAAVQGIWVGDHIPPPRVDQRHHRPDRRAQSARGRRDGQRWAVGGVDRDRRPCGGRWSSLVPAISASEFGPARPAC